jgi:hypothetical protein
MRKINIACIVDDPIFVLAQNHAIIKLLRKYNGIRLERELMIV